MSSQYTNKVFANLETNFSILVLLLAFGLSGCQPPHESEVSGDVQGTPYQIRFLLSGTSTSLEEVRRQVTAELAEIDAQMSSYREDSEISRINRLNRVTWLPVSKEIAGLLGIARTVSERTGGCYDLTLEPLLDLWKVAQRANKTPDQEEINALLPHVGMSLLEVDVINQRIRKRDPKLKIDFSSILQGYTVGVLARLMEALGIRNYLVDIGGQVMVRGHKANGDDWHVGIETPNPLTHELENIIYVREKSGTAIMTAGTYLKDYEERDNDYPLIINPNTGRPVVHDLRSVTVMHDDPAWGDAWDTALLCVGEKEAARIAEEEHLKALLIYDDKGKLDTHTSSAFEATQ